MNPRDRMMRWFADDGYVAAIDFAPVCRKFRELAEWLETNAEPGPERTVAFRKLLESREAAFRALIYPGG